MKMYAMEGWFVVWGEGEALFFYLCHGWTWLNKGFYFLINWWLTFSICVPWSSIFELAYLCSTPRNSSSTRLKENSIANTSISSMAKMRSSSLLRLLAVIVVSQENDDCIFDAQLVHHLRIMNFRYRECLKFSGSEEKPA